MKGRHALLRSADRFIVEFEILPGESLSVTCRVLGNKAGVTRSDSAPGRDARLCRWRAPGGQDCPSEPNTVPLRLKPVPRRNGRKLRRCNVVEAQAQHCRSVRKQASNPTAATHK